MKKLISGAKTVLLGATLLAMSSPAFAQLGDVGSLLQAGKDDAKVLLRGYMSPLVNSFGAGLNTGWVQTAKTHGLLGFHVKVGMAGIMVPDADQSFTLTNNDLSALQIASGSSSPTFAGSRRGSTYRFESTENNPISGDPLFAFNMPNGSGLPYGIAPVIQAGVGLIKGIQLNVRFVPETELGKFGSIGMWGVGIQHDIMQYIPLANKLPLLDLAVTGAYSQLNMSANLNLAKPSGVNDPQNLSVANQALDWTTTAWNVNIIGGAATPFIKILSVYAGVGLENAGTALLLKGNYPYQTLNNNVPPQPELAYVSNEEITFETETAVRALAGLRLRLAVVNINVEYTVATYQSVTFGVGIGLR